MRTDKACRRGQAMIEMAIGMLVFALILGGLISFGSIIPESMRLQTMVRRMAGYDAQRETSGDGDGAPMHAIDSVLSEPEILPVGAPERFAEATTRPFEFRSRSLNFAIDIEEGSAEWIWGGETTFRGLEECHMPVMTIPEFPVEEVVK